MILKALYDYYHRKVASNNGEKIPPFGFQKVPISFVIVIDENGKYQRISDVREDDARYYILPREIGRTSGIAPNSLWDNAQYILAYSKKDTKKEKERAIECNKSFIKKCKELSFKYPHNIGLRSIVSFYENDGINCVMNDTQWEDIKALCSGTKTVNFTFQLNGELSLIAENDSLGNIYEPQKGDNICLVSGIRGKLVELTGRSPINGSKATSSLVAVQESSGYDSYGKGKCYNSPISENAEFSYVTALGMLTAKDSRNKFSLGSRTFLFWASNTNAVSMEAEEGFFSFLESNKTDNPDRDIEKIVKSWKSIWSGEKPTSDDDRFYMLGLAPNAARIAVVYWNECSIKEFAGKILRHFEDMEIIDGRKEQKPYIGIYAMLSAVTLGGKQSDVQPNLPEAVLKSIVQGLPYPYTLFAACIRRIKAELAKKDSNGRLINACTIQRMAIIKAYLNRINENSKIHVMLDKENNNQGYVCGRLFAVLEYAQKRANNITTIKERYMSAASATPAAVFSTLLNLNVHHVEKLDSAGARFFIETMKQEIVSLLPADGFPSHLDLQDQGRFFVGYYHQMQDIYSGKTKETEE